MKRWPNNSGLPSKASFAEDSALSDATRIEQKAVRWHVAQSIGRLKLTPKQRKMALQILRRYLETSDSRIVKVSALRAPADLAGQDHKLRPGVTRLARQALETGAPSLKARAKKLLRESG